jgi:hypothetical protein
MMFAAGFVYGTILGTVAGAACVVLFLMRRL